MTRDQAPDGLLERALTLDALRWAWLRVRENDGAPGLDGVSLARFGRLLDANLLALADEVRTGTYQPGRLRDVAFFDGGKRRELAIPAVRDRVLQRSVLETLMPLLDPRFLPCSFGYRPGRSLYDAIQRIVRLRDRGFDWVVDADIRDCFGSLDHAVLGARLDVLVPDPGVRALLARWIAGPDVAEGPGERRTRGIPLGSVVSPLLCNVYLHQLDTGLTRRRYHLIRYADDFVVLCKSEAHAARAHRATEKVLTGLHLQLNAKKTRIVSFADGFEFLGVQFEGSDYYYTWEGKRIVVDDLPPDWFHYHPAGYGVEEDGWTDHPPADTARMPG